MANRIFFHTHQMLFSFAFIIFSKTPENWDYQSNCVSNYIDLFKFNMCLHRSQAAFWNIV